MSTPTPFDQFNNQPYSTLASPHIIGDGQLVLQSAANFGTPTATNKVRVVVISALNPAQQTIYTVTGISGNTLTGLTAVESTVDQGFNAGDLVRGRVTAGELNQFSSSINALEAPPVTTVVDSGSGTVTFDLSTTLFQKVVLTGNRTLAITNVAAGQDFAVALIQDSFGGRTVAGWWTGITWLTPSGSAPAIQQAANAVTLFRFKVIGTGVYLGWLAAPIVPSALPTTGLTIQQSIKPTSTAADGSTITFNLGTSDRWTTQLGGNRTLALSGATAGQEFYLTIQQAASGGPYTPTWFSGISWFGSPYSAPSMPTTASAYLSARFYCVTPGTYFGYWTGNSAS